MLLSIAFIIIGIIIVIAAVVVTARMVWRDRRSAGNMRRNGNVVVDTEFGMMVRGSTGPTRQRDCNSCWTISVLQTLTDRFRLRGEISPDDEFNHYTFHDWVIHQTPNIDGCQHGAPVTTAMDKSVELGVPLMSNTSDRRFDDTYIQSDLNAPRYHVQNWHTIPIHEAKDEIRRGGSVVVVTNLFDSFDYFMANSDNMGIYRPLGHESPDPNMVHMVSIVGYDDSDRTWILRNSYGTNWGYHGYFKVGYNDSKVIPSPEVFVPEI